MVFEQQLKDEVKHLHLKSIAIVHGLLGDLVGLSNKRPDKSTSDEDEWKYVDLPGISISSKN